MSERLDRFWSAALGAPLVILTDFDYTITQVDVGDLVVETLAPPSALTVQRFAQGEIGTRLYWLDSMNRVHQAEGEQVADTVAIDPYFPAFTAWAAAQGLPLAVVSDGFTFYIQRVLGREGLDHLPVFANVMQAFGDLAFPHGNPVCDKCGCCKAAVARRLKEGGAHIVYLGDGVSDLYAAGFADWVFAKGRLARYLEEHGAPYYPLDSFADPLRVLSADLEAFKTGQAPRRSSLGPNPLCRF